MDKALVWKYHEPTSQGFFNVESTCSSCFVKTRTHSIQAFESTLFRHIFWSELLASEFNLGIERLNSNVHLVLGKNFTANVVCSSGQITFEHDIKSIKRTRRLTWRVSGCEWGDREEAYCSSNIVNQDTAFLCFQYESTCCETCRKYRVSDKAGKIAWYGYKGVRIGK